MNLVPGTERLQQHADGTDVSKNTEHACKGTENRKLIMRNRP
jgi:hypothetical protein